MRCAPRAQFLLLLLLPALILPCDGVESPAPAAVPARVEVEPTWTSIYVGTVSLRMPPFARTPGGEYESTYAARVLPYFFYNETGRIAIRVSDEALQRLAQGEVIEFTGRAVNHAGEERGVQGKATPSTATGGKIKVRVRVSARIELIFNTTYRLSAGPTPSGR